MNDCLSLLLSRLFPIRNEILRIVVWVNYFAKLTIAVSALNVDTAIGAEFLFTNMTPTLILNLLHKKNK